MLGKAYEYNKLMLGEDDVRTVMCKYSFDNVLIDWVINYYNP